MNQHLEQLILDIFAIDSPSGYTKNVMEFLTEKVNALGFEMQYTNKGNGYVVVPGNDNSYTVGWSAHVDTLGYMVRSITADGKLKLTNIGGPLVPSTDGEYCKIYTRDGNIYTGTILSQSPSVHVYKDASSIERNIDTIEVRIDEKVFTKEDVEALGISAGDIVAYDPKTEITPSGFVKSRFIDDKISVVILLEVLDQISQGKISLKHQNVFLFSTFEEVGHGMSALPANISINEFISVDMGCIGLDLNCTEYDVSICAKDSSGPYDYDLTTRFIELAQQNKIAHAVDIYPMYGSDTSAALRGGNDVRGGLIGPGVAASHGMERTHMDAVDATIALIAEYVK